MVGITSTGIGSGLDIETLISKLMAQERKPLSALQSKEASYQAKLTGFGTLKGALSTFQNALRGLSSASKFQGATASVADATVASVTANASATTGAYSLEVSKLAQAQKLAAAGQVSDTATIGNGVITIDFGTISGGTLNSETGKYTGATFNSSGSGVKTITIDDTNNSLSGIRDAINKANIGVSASIINDGSGTPYRLALSSASTGKTSSMKISVSGSPELSSLLNHDPAASQALTETATAQNAEFKVNGIAISKTSNSVTDAITGVTLNLAKTNSGSATNITIARDTASVATAVSTFVTAYNNISQTLRDAMAYNADTKSAAILNGESSVRSIQAQVRSIMNTPISGGASAYTLLSQVGVTMGKDGLLSVNNTKLQSALSTNFSDFAGLFAAVGKTSDSLVTYDSATKNTNVGSYNVNITQLATKGTVVGSGASGLEVTTGVNDTLQVKLDGVTATITLSQGTYATAAALATEIQSKINGASAFSSQNSSVKVTESGGVFTLTSDRYGSASNVSITGGGDPAYFGLGGSATATAGLDVAGLINGIAASGSGQVLTGATGDSSEGIKLTIAGGSLGVRGMVNYSQGFAYKLEKLTESLLGNDGPISSRTEGISATIKRLAKDQARMADRMEAIEKRYRTQFTALDGLMSSMSTTSTFLTQQLSALANLNKQSS
jgi:flagellar hook-associated protein 2